MRHANHPIHVYYCNDYLISGREVLYSIISRLFYYEVHVLPLKQANWGRLKIAVNTSHDSSVYVYVHVKLHAQVQSCQCDSPPPTYFMAGN